MKNYKIQKKKKKQKNKLQKKKYNTIEEYLEKMLYPTLKIAIKDLINEIKNINYYKE